VFDKMRWQYLAGLLLISEMRNLANDVSQDRSKFNSQDIWSDNNLTFPNIFKAVIYEFHLKV
jgi:hypothetical protein